MRRAISALIAGALMIFTAGCAGKTADISVSAPTESTVESRPEVTLTMAIMAHHEDEYRFEKLVEPFDSADNGVTIRLKNYIDYSEPEFQLLQDIISTAEIDIVPSQCFSGGARFESLKNKGAFADLYTFMAEDPEINQTTLNSHILGLNETAGKLYALPVRYGVNSLVGEKKYVGSTQNWTFDEFADRWDAMPDGSTINGDSTSEYVYYTVVRENLPAFVDYEKAQVHFDSPEFRQLLEFCSRFRYGNGQREEYDGSSPDMVRTCRITGFDAAAGYFGDSCDLTVTGFPTLNGSGAYFHTLGSVYAINGSSAPEKQRAAWEFIRSLVTVEALTDSYAVANELVENGKKYVQYDIEHGFPVNNEAYEVMRADSLSGKYVSTGIGFDGEEYTSPIPTAAEMERLEAYLDGVDRWETIIDTALKEIVEEETFGYFAGESTVDQCIDRIQNRATIWVSEQ